MEYSQDKMEIRLDITEDEVSDDPCRPLTEAIRSIRRELRLQRKHIEELVARMDGLKKPEGDERRGADGDGENERVLAHALTRAIDEFTCALERFQSALSLAKAEETGSSRKACAPAQRLRPGAVKARVRRKSAPATLRVRVAAVKGAAGQTAAPAGAELGPAEGAEEAAGVSESAAVCAAVSDALFEASSPDAPANDKEKPCRAADDAGGAVSFEGPVGEGGNGLTPKPQEPEENGPQHERARVDGVFEPAGLSGRLAAGARRLRGVAGEVSGAL